MISFIIPVYNKGAVLYRTLSSLFVHLRNSHVADFEIIVVNDGSTDSSFEEAVRFKKFNGYTEKIHIYHYTKNIGKGFALRYGFSKSCGDPVVFLDGDMDIDTTQIVKLIQIYEIKRPDMVIGSKYHIRSRINYPLNRFFYSLILRWVIRRLFHLQITDSQVGLKLFRRDVLANVFPRMIIKRFAVDLELLVVAHMMGFQNIVEMPVVIKHSSANRSTIDFSAVKNFCVDILAIFYRKNILKYYTQTSPEFVPTFNIQVA